MHACSPTSKVPTRSRTSGWVFILWLNKLTEIVWIRHPFSWLFENRPWETTFQFNLQNYSLGTCNYGNRYGDIIIRDFLASMVRWFCPNDKTIFARIGWFSEKLGAAAPPPPSSPVPPAWRLCSCVYFLGFLRVFSWFPACIFLVSCVYFLDFLRVFSWFPACIFLVSCVYFLDFLRVFSWFPACIFLVSCVHVYRYIPWIYNFNCFLGIRGMYTDTSHEFIISIVFETSSTIKTDFQSGEFCARSGISFVFWVLN